MNEEKDHRPEDGTAPAPADDATVRVPGDPAPPSNSDDEFPPPAPPPRDGTTSPLGAAGTPPGEADAPPVGGAAAPAASGAAIRRRRVPAAGRVPAAPAGYRRLGHPVRPGPAQAGPDARRRVRGDRPGHQHRPGAVAGAVRRADARRWGERAGVRGRLADDPVRG